MGISHGIGRLLRLSGGEQGSSLSIQGSVTFCDTQALSGRGNPVRWLREPRLADLRPARLRSFMTATTARSNLLRRQPEDGPEGRRRGGRTTERSDGVSLRSVGDDVYRNVQFARRTGKESADIGG
jgi:hypothetical protein